MDKKYISLYNSIKTKILSGEYRQGEKLPSKRVTADMTGYSLITVENAYRMLIDEGYISSREKSGYFVELSDFSHLKKSTSLKPLSLLSEDVG
jgi:GntR family transcriptional regulator/MocR family aminotransferase